MVGVFLSAEQLFSGNPTSNLSKYEFAFGIALVSVCYLVSAEKKKKTFLLFFSKKIFSKNEFSPNLRTEH